MKKGHTPLAIGSNINTMSSVELAELTGKRTDNINAAIEKMFVDLELGALNFQGTYLSKQNKQVKCYYLPKRESLLLISGFNIRLRAKIIDRWQDLEEAEPKLPQTLHEALRLAADLEEQKMIMLPKVKAFERLSEAAGAHSLRESANPNIS